MRVTTLCLLSLSAATAFTQPSSSRPSFVTAHQQAPRSALHMSTIDQEVPIIVNGQNIELTEALTDHVKQKIGGTLAKLASGGAVTECDVILSVSKNPKVCVLCVSSISNVKRGANGDDGLSLCSAHLVYAPHHSLSHSCSLSLIITTIMITMHNLPFTIIDQERSPRGSRDEREGHDAHLSERKSGHVREY
jgi:hypothetical protein